MAERTVGKVSRDLEVSNNYQHIKFKIDDRVARLTFARPPVNIFNIAMMLEINDALNQCARRRELVAIVFDAAADCRAFSAGVAIEEHAEGTIFQMLDAFHAIFRNIEQIARPTIAVVDGAALGGGCELVAACDIAIASERARFGQPEIKLGVFPPVAAVLLPLVIGDKRARELILTGELIEAAEAARLGLVNYVVPGNELDQKTSEMVAGFRNLSAATLEHTKRALDIGRGRSLDLVLKELENMYLHELMKTHDAKEGIKSFVEKRKPEWNDR
jgi:cyclohexa-1,5-dienecarbonyl-CoA hydratase